MKIKELLKRQANTNKDIMKNLKKELKAMDVEVKSSDSELVIKKKDKKKLDKAIKELKLDDLTLQLMMDIVPVDKKIYIRKRIA